MRARAIENQCYVIAVNRVGSDQATSYNGYSAVIDAYGEPLTACTDEACIASADLDKRRLDVFRRQFPIFFNYDKRNDFFVDVARQKVDLTQVRSRAHV